MTHSFYRRRSQKFLERSLDHHQPPTSCRWSQSTFPLPSIFKSENQCLYDALYPPGRAPFTAAIPINPPSLCGIPTPRLVFHEMPVHSHSYPPPATRLKMNLGTTTGQSSRTPSRANASWSLTTTPLTSCAAGRRTRWGGYAAHCRKKSQSTRASCIESSCSRGRTFFFFSLPWRQVGVKKLDPCKRVGCAGHLLICGRFDALSKTCIVNSVQ